MFGFINGVNYLCITYGQSRAHDTASQSALNGTGVEVDLVRWENIMLFGHSVDSNFVNDW